MASEIVICKVTLDADATRIVQTVSAMLKAHSHPAGIDEIVSNAVRIAFGQRVDELVRDAARRESGPVTSTY